MSIPRNYWANEGMQYINGKLMICRVQKCVVASVILMSGSLRGDGSQYSMVIFSDFFLPSTHI
jgi:hypothetical protein